MEFDVLNTVMMLKASANGFCNDTKDIWELLGLVVRILQFVIPVIIILLGTIDLAKAVMAGKDDEIKNAQKMFIKRLIYGVVVFFVVLIVQAVFGLIGKASDSTASKCFTCVSTFGDC